jgi:hypothetical protein
MSKNQETSYEIVDLLGNKRIVVVHKKCGTKHVLVKFDTNFIVDLAREVIEARKAKIREQIELAGYSVVVCESMDVGSFECCGCKSRIESVPLATDNFVTLNRVGPTINKLPIE